MEESNNIRLPRTGNPLVNLGFALLLVLLAVLFTLKSVLGVVTYPLQFVMIGVDKFLEKKKLKKRRDKVAADREKRRNRKVQEKVRLMHPFENP